MKTVDDLVMRWNNARGPFGNIGWCEFCKNDATDFVQAGTEFYFLCRIHYKQFTKILAWQKSSLDDGEVDEETTRTEQEYIYNLDKGV